MGTFTMTKIACIKSFVQAKKNARVNVSFSSTESSLRVVSDFLHHLQHLPLPHVHRLPFAAGSSRTTLRKGRLGLHCGLVHGLPDHVHQCL